MQATSEQDLKRLLEEGKITDEEYRQLLDAICQKDKPHPPLEEKTKAQPRTGFGKAALILLILSVMMPALTVLLSFVLSALRMKMLLAALLLLAGLPCALLAFVFGIIGWKSAAGKAAVIGVPALGFFAIVAGLFILTLYRYAEVKQEWPQEKMELVRSYPLDSMEGVIQQEDIVFDPEISSDGKGSLRIHANRIDKTVFRLFETGPLGIQNRILVYSAKLRSESLSGKAYLEMWCDLQGRGEYFSRSIEQPVTGTTEWTSIQTPFRLEAGQMPANVKLNLAIEGDGTVWIDDIKLLSGPLN